MKKTGFMKAIKEAVRKGKLREPFRASDVRNSVTGFAPRTYTNFLSKHRKGNPSGTTELFVLVSKGLYRINKT